MWILAACVHVSPPSRHEPPLVTGARIDWVELEGQGPIDLLEDCLRDCPREDSGHPVPSRTWYSVRWNWYGSGDAPCIVAAVTMKIDVVVSLPAWTPPPDADPALVAAWKDYVVVLGEHEQGHVDLVDAYARPFASTRGSCTDLPFRGSRMLGALREAQAAYDVLTAHGRLQGARFFGG